MTRLLTLLAVLVAAGDGPAERAKLRGRWAIISAAFDGKETPAGQLKDRELLFDDKSFTASVGGKKRNTIRYTLDPSKSPGQIDLRREGVEGASLGIYTLDGDELKLCYGEPGAARPTEF